MITVELDDEAALLALRGASATLQDMTPLMAQIAEMLLVNTRDRFGKGTDPDGNAWAPRKPSTLAAYAARKPPAKPGPHPLDLTGYLQRSLFPFHGPDEAGVASPAIYAAVMQFGAGQGAFGASIGKDKLGRDHFHTIPWGDIPARPFLGVSEADRTGILDLVAEALDQATGAAP